MTGDSLPILISVIIAILGAGAGVAAILKVNADNSASVASASKSVSEGAKAVVDLMSDRLDEQEERMDQLENYVNHFDEWADRLLDILDRAVMLMPEALRQQFEEEGRALRASRPKRPRPANPT